MAKLKKITINGIDCYGQVSENSNFLVVGWLSDGSEMDDFYMPDTSYKNWATIVKKLRKWADDNGHEINELTAC